MSAYARRVDYLTRNRIGGAEDVVDVIDQRAVSLVKPISKQCDGASAVNRCVPICNRNRKSFRLSRIGSGVGRLQSAVGTCTVLDRLGISSKLEARLGRMRGGRSRGR
jgi:hypothetical protein